MSLRDPALIGITQARTPERTQDSLRRIGVLERKPGGGGGGGTPSGTISGHLGGSTWPALNIATTATPRLAGLGIGRTGPASGISIGSAVGAVSAINLYEDTTLKATIQYQPAYAPAGAIQFAAHDGDNFWAFTNFGTWDGSSQTFASNRITLNPTPVNGSVGDRGVPGVTPGTPANDWITSDDANTGNTATFAITGATNATPIVITAVGHTFTNGTRVYINGVGGNTAANGQKTVSNVATNTFELAGVAGNGAYTSGGYVWADFTTWAAYSCTTDFDTRGSFHAFKAGNITASEIEGIYGLANVSIAKTGTGGKWRVTHATTDFANLTTGDTWQIYQTGVTALNLPWVVTAVAGNPRAFDLDGSSGITDPGGLTTCTARRCAYHEVTSFQGWTIQDSMGALTKCGEIPVYVNNSKQGRTSACEFATIEYNNYDSYNRDSVFGSGSVWKDYGSTIGVFTGQTESGFGEIGTGILVRTTGSANIRRPFVYQDAGVDLITMDRWGNMGIGNAARVDQSTHLTGLPALLTIAPSSPAYSAAQGIQFGTVASVTTPISLYLGVGALLCNGIFDAPTYRITGTGGEGYIRFLEQGTLPTTANANQCRLYGEVDAAGTALGYIDDLGVRKTLATTTTGTSATPGFTKVGVNQAANTFALSFAADTVNTGGIDFGGDAHLYRYDVGILRSTTASLSIPNLTLSAPVGTLPQVNRFELRVGSLAAPSTSNTLRSGSVTQYFGDMTGWADQSGWGNVWEWRNTLADQGDNMLGFRSSVSYGGSTGTPVAAKGTVHAFTANVNVYGAGINATNSLPGEQAAFFAGVVDWTEVNGVNGATSTSPNSGQSGGLWGIDMAVSGSRSSVTNRALLGYALRIQQYQAASPTSAPSAGILVSGRPTYGNYPGVSTSYPVDYGIQITGVSGTVANEAGSSATQLFKTALGIGGDDSLWSDYSRFGTGIAVASYETYGIRIWKRWAGSTGPSLSLGWDSAGAASFAAADGIDFAGTVALYAGAANVLYTPDAFGVQQTAVPATTTSGSGFYFGNTGTLEQMRNATGTFYRLYGNTADVVGTPTLRGRVLAAGVIWEFSAAGGNALDLTVSRTAAGILQVSNQVSATTGFLGGLGGTAVASTGLDTATGLATRRSDNAGLVNGANADVVTSTKSFVQFTGAATTAQISSLDGGVDGKHLTLYNATAGPVIINDETAALGTAANRIRTSTAANRTIAVKGAMELRYNSGVSRWLEAGGVGVT